VECIYFMSQVITTVGYGDICPAKPRGQVFVGLYVLGALFLIAMIISSLTDHMVKLAEDYKEKQRAASSLTARERFANTLFKGEKPTMGPLLSALMYFAILDICWILFFVNYPGEGKTWGQAIYMSIVTLSTVGFGAFTPVTEAGMIFGAFMMLFGSAALVNVIGEFATLMCNLNQYEQILAEKSTGIVDTLRNMVKPGSKAVSELQFLRFGLLQMKSVDPEDIDRILKVFKTLGPKQGKVPFRTVEDLVKIEYAECERTRTRTGTEDSKASQESLDD